jgi:hypothetical protein
MLVCRDSVLQVRTPKVPVMCRKGAHTRPTMSLQTGRVSIGRAQPSVTWGPATTLDNSPNQSRNLTPPSSRASSELQNVEISVPQLT